MRRFRTSLLILLVVLLACPTQAQPSTKFRSGMFFHLSTGRNIWGQEGATTSVPAEVRRYNLAHGLSGLDSVSLRETIWWPQPDNMWSTWHRVFDNALPGYDLRPFYSTEKIIMIKACFPSSNMGPGGAASDTLNPTLQNVFNFKWHWRSIVSVMRQHPLNFFVIWTNAPQVASQTTDDEARAAEAACRWAKDTLALGRDALFGTFPANVYVFDFFHKLALPNGKLDPAYQASSSDAHPNAAATNLVAPLLVTEVFDASLAYEKHTPAEVGALSSLPAFSLRQNYPNPFNPTTTIPYILGNAGVVRLTVHDLLGREVAVLVNERREAGFHEVAFDGRGLSSGVYVFRLQAGRSSDTKRLLLLR